MFDHGILLVVFHKPPHPLHPLTPHTLPIIIHVLTHLQERTDKQCQDDMRWRYEVDILKNTEETWNCSRVHVL